MTKAIGTIQKYEYGTAVIIGYNRSRLGTWTRSHVYTRDDDQQEFYETVHCLDDSDVSLMHERRDYDPNCSCCWLNIGHTKDLHNAKEEKE